MKPIPQQKRRRSTASKRVVADLFAHLKPSSTLLHGDCLQELATLTDNSVDLVLTDLPYGTTACAWDSVIPMPALWRELYRVAKTNAAFMFTAQQPFSWNLCASNPAHFCYGVDLGKVERHEPVSSQVDAHEATREHSGLLSEAADL
jgi:site-specific DNA-methyltransferase (adenine-specific)